MQWTKIRDGLNLTRRLNILRIWNIIQVLSSYYLSRSTKKAIHFGYPVSVSVEPTTACNLRCPECPSGLRQFTRPTGMLGMELFDKIVEELHRQTFYMILYFQGEPYLNKYFFDFVERAEKKKIYTATSTNAHYLHDLNAKKTVTSGLSRLIISIDGATQKTYESYRKGGKLEKVLEGARNVVKWKKQLRSSTPYIIFQFLVVRPNEHETEKIREIARETGVDEVKFKTAQVYDYKNGNPLIPENSKYSRYKKKKNGTYRIKNKLLNHCWKLWHSCVITWDGKVVPCCFDKDAAHRLGDLSRTTFGYLWKDKPYRDFRRSILHSRKNIDICANCTEGTRVWI